MVDNLKPIARIVTACCVLHNISKKFSVPLPSKLILEDLHSNPELSQEEQGNIVDTKEAVEDMIEMYFGNSGDEEEEGELKTHVGIQKRHKPNDNISHKHFSES